MITDSPVLVGITGRKRAGKNTAAEMLALFTPTTARVISFADPIREVLLTLDPLVPTPVAAHGYMSDATRLGLALEMCGGWEAVKSDPVLGPEVRRLLQTAGTELGRALDPDVWTNLMRKRIERHMDDGMSIIIPDMRFPNEVALIKSWEGVTLRVISPRQDSDDTHSSENMIDTLSPVDTIIDNSGSLADLWDSMRTLAHALWH